MSSVRVLFVALGGEAELETSVRQAAADAEVEHVGTAEAAVESIREHPPDVCFAPSVAGPDASASLTLGMARAGAYVPVVAVVDDPVAGFEAIADEGAADFVWRGDLTPASVQRALLVAHARAEAVARYQAVQADRDALLAATASVVASLDGDGTLLDFRTSTAREADFSEAVPGARFVTLFSGETRADALAALERAQQGGTGRFVQTRARAGRPLLLRWSVAQSGRGYRAVGVDGSEVSRETARAELHRVVLEAILEQAPVTVFVVDAEGDFLLVLGEEYAEAGLQGRSIFEAYRDEPRVLQNVRQALDGDSFDDLVTLRDGRRYTVHYAPMPLGPNEPPGALGVAVNVTDSQPSGLERCRLDTLCSLVNDAVLIVDAGERPTYLSPDLVRLLGRTAVDIEADGGLASLFVDPKVRSLMARSVRGGDSWTGDAVLRGRDGRSVPVSIDASPVFDSEGAWVGGIARLVAREESHEARRDVEQ